MSPRQVTESSDLTQPPTGCADDRVNQNPCVEGDTQPTQLTQPPNEKLKKNKPEPIHTEFKVGDKVKQSKNWVPIGDNPWHGDVIEVIKPNVDGDRETYKVRWRNLEAPLVQEKYGYEIEIDTRKFRTYEDLLP